ncbi:MAG: mechanosensitive ion channel family protein, partial [Halothece sp.]
MEIVENLQQVFAIETGIQDQLYAFAGRLLWFTGLTLVALLLGRALPTCLKWGMYRFTPSAIVESYERVVAPLRILIIRSGILVITAININLFRPYPGLYEFLKLAVYLPLTLTVAWLLSRLVRQIFRLYGVKILQHFHRQAEDFLLMGETLANIVIGFFATIFFAQTQSINLMSLLTGIGIGGIAVAFAAKEVLSQVVGTVLIYLDRPYVSGEYIRANFNPRDEDIYGRVESIGIRST